MNRRTFLQVVGAVTSLRIGRPDTDVTGGDTESDEQGVDITSLATSLPAASDLSEESSVAFSVTRLDDKSVTATADLVADATAYATVFSGPTATDVAVGIPDGEAFRNRLTATGYDALDSRDGWSLFGRRLRTRYRIVGISDSTAVLGAGPIRDTVANDVREAMDAIDGRDGARDACAIDRRAILERLGGGTHLTVDMRPDPRRTADSVAATGSRYQVRGETTAIRDVTLFDSPSNAHTAGDDALDPGRRFAGRPRGDGSVDRHGRAVVRESIVPTEPI